MLNDANIPGCYGRLGDLGRCTNPEIEKVITSVFPMALNNIVVKDPDAGSKVLKFFEVNDFGRVTCIVLSMITGYEKSMRY